ncbi:CcmD family protein [Flexibacter flexilis DSM 6793]|uniref:CcmD family protein n=1 Tax=Flexibacter flexilis DSM 6793 TaxID=927664 RepID=A0A1I1J303_9BACT|nr:CcmD family protein [Flexibacter flexilis]SFC42491.1 CcmD family protein [Flexibacter flexilis DSM 6793]
MKKVFLLLLLNLVVFGQNVWAQMPNAQVEMADKFRADGKIYVVITVASIIILGMAAYMATLDRKISKLEKEIGQQN